MQSQQEIQQLARLLQSYEQTIEVLNQQRALVDATIDEHEEAVEALSSLADMDEAGTVIVPIGADEYIYATVEDTERVLSGVGSDVVVQEDVESAIERSRDRIDELEDGRERIEERVEEITEEAEKLQARAQELMQQQR